MDWQTPITILIVLGAGTYLAARIFRTFSGGSRGCGSCSGDRTGAQIKPLVTLEPGKDQTEPGKDQTRGDK